MSASVLSPADVSREALSWVGVPFRWQGRSRAGLDCGGLAAVVGVALGVIAEPLEVARYRPPLPSGYLLAELRRHLRERAHEGAGAGCGNRAPDCCGECRDALAGCVVTMRVPGHSDQHCGIVTDDGRLVSVTQAGGCRVVSYTPVLLRVTRNVFEFPGVDYAPAAQEDDRG